MGAMVSAPFPHSSRRARPASLEDKDNGDGELKALIILTLLQDSVSPSFLHRHDFLPTIASYIAPMSENSLHSLEFQRRVVKCVIFFCP